ncbi:unnamed protein product [Arabidopsis thaliana]|uniref:PUM-HD domain-containing protein n=1 Tax=Arabidopsis thaliana TaxID=3702 RepID=A0A5S9YBL6_ARATH|nr:unnamed protein product [Arabidopsis thaliana]
MDNKFYVNTNGERNIWFTAAEENMTTAASSSQSQPPQMQSSKFHQPENHIHINDGFSSGAFDLQTLESSVRGLSFADSNVHQNGNPILPAHQYNQVFNGGGGSYGDGYLFPPSGSYHHYELKDLQRFNQNQQRLSYQNDCVNRSYVYDTNGGGNGMLNNGFLNGVTCASRNRVSDYYTNSFGYGVNTSWRSNEGCTYNQDQAASSMENGRGSYFFIATDRVWSKELEKTIFVGTKETIDMIFDGLIVGICELMVDPFGNDVVKLLIGKCSSEQIILIVDVVTRHISKFVNICFNPIGTLAIQVLLTSIHERANNQIPRIMDAISSVALQLTRNTNAKYVILACFSMFTSSQCRCLLEVVSQHCYQIAIDQNGCCLLQQCFDKERVPNHEIRQRLISEVIEHALKLCLNCHGNYVVQYVLELDNQHVTDELVKKLIRNYANLARNKYGSHVVQKLLKLRGIDSKLIVVDLLRGIDTLLLDPFGNYVIQTAWFVSKEDVRQMLRYYIERNIRLMRCNKFGNKILEKLNI